MNARLRLAARALVLLLACLPLVDGRLAIARAAASAAVRIILDPVSPAMASCLYGASATATIVPGPGNDTMTFHATGLPPFAGLVLAAANAPRAPYGASWPLSITQADASGAVDMQVRALLLGAQARTGAAHLVLFFSRAEDAGPCAAPAAAGAVRLASGYMVGPAALGTVRYPRAAGPLAAAPFLPPGSGISTPGGRFSLTKAPITFTTACQDPAGWQAIRFIDFRLSSQGGTAFWARLDRPAKRMYLYDTGSKRWIGGLRPGAAGVLQTSPLVQLVLASSSVLGSNGATGSVRWTLRFLAGAAGRTFLQSVRVIDVRDQTRGWTASGTWGVK